MNEEELKRIPRLSQEKVEHHPFCWSLGQTWEANHGRKKRFDTNIEFIMTLNFPSSLSGDLMGVRDGLSFEAAQVEARYNPL